MQALIDFISGMRTTDAIIVLVALFIFIAYVVICAVNFLRHEIAVFRGLIEPEYYEDDDDEEFEEEEAEYYSTEEQEWH